MAVRYLDPNLRTGAQIGPPFLVRLSIRAATPVSIVRGNFRAAVMLRARPLASITVTGG